MNVLGCFEDGGVGYGMAWCLFLEDGFMAGGDGGCMMEVLVFFEIGGGVWFDGGVMGGFRVGCV